jgi:hypothetical protein
MLQLASNMEVSNFLENVISNNLLREQIGNKRHTELMGKLSGSILGSPLQAQILHMLGIGEKQQDPYVLRKFQRGHDVEAWVMKHVPGLTDRQTDITYRGARGHIDALVDMAEWDAPELGVIPHEIKSVTNAAYKWIKRSGAKWSHKLQAGMYALATDADYFMIHYIASDDYRILSFLFDIKEIAPDVDLIIDEVEDQLMSGLLPEFKSREDWQNNKEYQNYPTWSSLTQEELMLKLESEYPDAYERLISYAKKKGGEI